MAVRLQAALPNGYVLAAPLRDQQPSVPAVTDLAAPIADLAHLLFIAVPVPPEFPVCPNFDGAHSFGDDRGLKPYGHVIGSP